MRLCRPAIYLALFAVSLVNLGFHLFTHARISADFAVAFGAPALALALMLFAVNRQIARSAGLAARILTGLALLFEGVLLIALLVLTLRVADHISMVTRLPYVDSGLAAADRFFGIDWLAYWEWVHDHPALHQPLSVAYTKLEIATLVIVVAFCLIGRVDKARHLVEAFIVCAVISLFFGMIWPARGPVETLIGDASGYGNFSYPPGVYHLAALDYLRQTAAPVVIGDTALVGLVTFPSLHTATGILMVGAAAGTFLVWPALAYAALMIAATPVWGGHYFVDLMGGTVMALLVLAAVRRPAGAGWPMASLRTRWRADTGTPATGL